MGSDLPSVRSSKATPADLWRAAVRTTDSSHQRQITNGANPPDLATLNTRNNGGPAGPDEEEVNAVIRRGWLSRIYRPFGSGSTWGCTARIMSSSCRIFRGGGADLVSSRVDHSCTLAHGDLLAGAAAQADGHVLTVAVAKFGRVHGPGFVAGVRARARRRAGAVAVVAVVVLVIRLLAGVVRRVWLCRTMRRVYGRLHSVD
jgi:hypothetical protein